MKKFSTKWKGSSKPRRQRNHRMNAPLHIKKKFVHAHLSKDLKKKYGKRSTGLRKGDKVKVIIGEFRKHEGKIERIDLKKTQVFVSGIETTKKDGTKKLLPVHPSNLIITEMGMEDKIRQEILSKK